MAARNEIKIQMEFVHDSKQEKFIAKSSGINREYGKEINRIGSPLHANMSLCSQRNIRTVEIVRKLFLPHLSHHSHSHSHTFGRVFLSVLATHSGYAMNTLHLYLKDSTLHCIFAVYYLPVLNTRVHLFSDCVCMCFCRSVLWWMCAARSQPGTLCNSSEIILCAPNRMYYYKISYS